MLNFNQLAFLMRSESENFKRKFAEILENRDSKKEEVKKTYIKGTPAYKKTLAELDAAAEQEIAQMRIDTANNIAPHINKLRESESEKLTKINETTLQKLKMLDGIPLTAAELGAIADKYNLADDYYSARYLSVLAEKNGLEFIAGIEPAYDTKMAVLDDLEAQLIEVLTSFDTSKHCDPKIKYANLSETVIERAGSIYNGGLSASSPEQIAAKALLAIDSAHGFIEKGIKIANSLKNSNETVKNNILCGIALNGNISDNAISYSGYAEEIRAFKNGLAEEFVKAKKCVENMGAAKDVETAAYYIAELGTNQFVEKMVKEAAKSNIVINDYMSTVANRDFQESMNEK